MITLQTNNDKKIDKAMNIAEHAIGIFTSTLNDLKKSNDMLHDVINCASNKIKEHELHIVQSKVNIQENNKVISKLQEFVK